MVWTPQARYAAALARQGHKRVLVGYAQRPDWVKRTKDAKPAAKKPKARRPRGRKK